MSQGATSTRQIPTKVTLEITADGWAWSVFSGDNEMARHEMRRAERGVYKGVGKGDIYDRLPDGLEDLAVAIDESDEMGVCQVLDDVRES